jgi:hypothetical protein
MQPFHRPIVDHLLLQEGLPNLLLAAALVAIALAADGRARWLLVAGALLGVGGCIAARRWFVHAGSACSKIRPRV